MMHGHEKSDLVIVAVKPANKGVPPRSSPRRNQPLRSRWSKGRGPRGMRIGKARTGLSAGRACHRRWTACGKPLPFGPEVGAVCGKAACTDLCGGRSAMSVPTATARQSWCDPAGARSYAGVADEVVPVRFSSTISRIGETNGNPHGEHSVRRKQ
jgi:hypothetical protein